MEFISFAIMIEVIGQIKKIPRSKPARQEASEDDTDKKDERSLELDDVGVGLSDSPSPSPRSKGSDSPRFFQSAGAGGADDENKMKAQKKTVISKSGRHS